MLSIVYYRLRTGVLLQPNFVIRIHMIVKMLLIVYYYFYAFQKWKHNIILCLWMPAVRVKLCVQGGHFCFCSHITLCPFTSSVNTVHWKQCTWGNSHPQLKSPWRFHHLLSRVHSILNHITWDDKTHPHLLCFIIKAMTSVTGLTHISLSESVGTFSAIFWKPIHKWQNQSVSDIWDW